MKVVFSITYFSPYVSGLTIYAQRLAELLAKNGHEVTIVCSRHDESLPSVEHDVVIATGPVAQQPHSHPQGDPGHGAPRFVPPATVRRVPFLFKLSKGFVMPSWIQVAWEEIQNTDSVVIHLPQVEGVFTAIVAKLLKKPIIAVYHCEVSLPSGFLNSIIGTLLEKANSIVLALAETIVTYTDDYAKHSKLLSQYKKKIKTVYPPIPVPVVDKNTQEILEKKINRKNGDVTVGFAGRVATEKGIEYALQAIAELNSKIKDQRSKLIKNINNIKFVVAGPMNPVGEEEYRKKILSLIEKQSENVVFLGSLNQEEIGAFYASIDMLVLPSVNSTEAFGMVQVEAMMMGVPAIASDLPGVRVPIRETGMGMVVPLRSSDHIAEAIIEINNNRNKYSSSPLIEKVRNTFDMEKTGMFYERLLKEVVH